MASPRTTALGREIRPAPEGSRDVDSTWERWSKGATLRREDDPIPNNRRHEGAGHVRPRRRSGGVAVEGEKRRRVQGTAAVRDHLAVAGAVAIGGVYIRVEDSESIRRGKDRPQENPINDRYFSPSCLMATAARHCFLSLPVSLTPWSATAAALPGSVYIRVDLTSIGGRDRIREDDSRPHLFNGFLALRYFHGLEDDTCNVYGATAATG